MGLSSAVGHFSTGTGAVGATVAVSGLGFQPKAVLFWWSGRTETVDTTARRSHMRGYGCAASATSRWWIASASQDTPTTMVAKHAQGTDACVAIFSTTPSAIDGKLDFTSFDTGGFTLTVTDAFTSSFTVSYLALGGTDITNVAAGSFQSPVVTGTQDQTGPGFQPDFLLLAASGQATNDGTVGSDSGCALGFASGPAAANQVVWTGGSNDGSATSATNAYCTSGQIGAGWAAAMTSLNIQFALNAWLSSGFQLNYTMVPAGAGWINYLAIKGGRWSVGDLLSATSLTTIAETGVGFTPTGLVTISAMRAKSTAGTVTTHDQWSMGAATDATHREAHAVVDQNAAATAVVGSSYYLDELYVNLTTAAAMQGLADLQSMDADGFTVIMDDADPAQEYIGYVAFAPNPLISGTDSATLSESAAVTVPVPSADSAALSEAAALAIAVSDSATESESASLVATATGSDSATASESAVVSQLGADAATESESAVVGAVLASSDSATLSDASAIAQASSDSATESESASLAAIASASDSAVLSESAVLSQDGSDAATQSDSSVVAAALPATDSGTLAETSGLAQASSDSATVVALAAVTVAVTSTDAASATEASTIAQAATDAATESESASLATANTGADSGTLAETSRLSQAASDSATQSDSQALSAALPASDAVTLTESATVFQGGQLSVSDSGALSETSVLAQASSDNASVTASAGLAQAASDSAALSAAAALTATVAGTDGASLSETAVLTVRYDVTDAAALAESFVAGASVQGTDGASLADAAAQLAVALDASDLAVLAETIVLDTYSRAGTDQAVLSESAAVAIVTGELYLTIGAVAPLVADMSDQQVDAVVLTDAAVFEVTLEATAPAQLALANGAVLSVTLDDVEV